MSKRKTLLELGAQSVFIVNAKGGRTPVRLEEGANPLKKAMQLAVDAAGTSRIVECRNGINAAMAFIATPHEGPGQSASRGALMTRYNEEVQTFTSVSAGPNDIYAVISGNDSIEASREFQTLQL